MDKIPFEIEFLCDRIHFADEVAKWIYEEFIQGVRHGVSFENVSAAVRNCHRNKMPIRLIAVVDGQCAGTVSIVENDLRCRSYTPWLASLYVGRDYRCRGIGEALIEAVKGIVWELGYSELYLRTQTASDYYRRLGWQFIENCADDFNLTPDVFKFTKD